MLIENTGSAARDFCMLERNLLSHLKLALLLSLLSSSVLLRARLVPEDKPTHLSGSMGTAVASLQFSAAIVAVIAGGYEYYYGYDDLRKMHAFLVAVKPHFALVSVVVATVFLTWLALELHPLETYTMQGWNQLSSSISSFDFGASANKIAKGFNSSVQATRERFGTVAPEEITELPQEYRDLEARVDALKSAHLALLKITNVYETETYDYPVQIAESVGELSTSIGVGITNFASTNLKGTNLPAPAPIVAPAQQHKTLPHALGRSATAAATAIQTTNAGAEDKLGKALALYADGWEKIAAARVQHDDTVRNSFLHPWQQTLSTSINVAVKARQAVRVSRLELDAAKQALKNAGPAKQEQARLEVENAEDDLVQKTEVAISLMKAVLENPEPIKNLNELAKAQLLFFSTAAESLSGIQGEVEELSVAAEGEYRKSRDH
ncbi:hypothetical protein MKEN_01078600 [Mycena kentingensis (nom. inval.)]|nr:hypothetical protein MKEN_01078600 [Mycena kentingensis (nom. inval.)]